MQKKGNRNILLATAYFPPVSYMACLMMAEKAFIEKEENYQKQTYRNRCTILSANGLLTLSVPVQRGSFHKTALKDLKIDYQEDWRSNHWRALTAAYNASPYFEFYAEDILKVLNKKYSTLLEMNMQILLLLHELLELDTKILLTTAFQPPDKGLDNDFRTSIQPKKGSTLSFFHAIPYTQVFSDRMPFVPDLSILDTLFNLGPETATYLRNCIL